MPPPARPVRALAVALVLIAAIGAPHASAAPSGLIHTVAGTGVSGFRGDGGPATHARLSFPIDVAPVPAAQGGGFLIADESNNRIRRVSGTGVITTVAGTGAVCPGIFPNDPNDPCGDTGPATEALLDHPTGVAPLPGGGFLVADRGDGVIRKVDAGGVISTVAGTGDTCRPLVATGCGNGGRATAARFDAPDRVAPLPAGGFLVTEDEGNRVRRVGSGGMVTTVAGRPGGGVCLDPQAACGDGGTATKATLHAPNGIATLSGGGFLVTDSLDNRVRKVSAKGLITTVAGNGVQGSFGDGVAATDANLNAPSDVAVAPDGSIVIADTDSQIVRRVAGKVIRTIAGIADSPGAGPDGVPATESNLDVPFGVAVTPGGDVLIADHESHRIRRVDSNLVPA
jgi:NHL repeat